MKEQTIFVHNLRARAVMPGCGGIACTTLPARLAISNDARVSRMRMTAVLQLLQAKVAALHRGESTRKSGHFDAEGGDEFNRTQCVLRIKQLPAHQSKAASACPLAPKRELSLIHSVC